MRRAGASAFSGMPSISVVLGARWLIQVSVKPLTASTNTTRPTSAITYLANRPSRRNQILSLTAIIQILHGRLGPRRQAAPAHAGLGTASVSLQIAGRRSGKNRQ